MLLVQSQSLHGRKIPRQKIQDVDIKAQPQQAED